MMSGEKNGMKSGEMEEKGKREVNLAKKVEQEEYGFQVYGFGFSSVQTSFCFQLPLASKGKCINSLNSGITIARGAHIGYFRSMSIKDG